MNVLCDIPLVSGIIHERFKSLNECFLSVVFNYISQCVRVYIYIFIVKIIQRAKEYARFIKTRSKLSGLSESLICSRVRVREKCWKLKEDVFLIRVVYNKIRYFPRGFTTTCQRTES